VEIMLLKDQLVSARNMGDCRNLSWNKMLQRFIDCYGGHYTEAELKRIHDKWKRLSAEAGWKI
jgi:hypothetical protein